MLKIFKNECKVTRIGGRLQEDYLRLRGVVLSFNSNYFPLFYLTGFNEPGDLDEILRILLSPTSREAALREAYIERVTKEVLEGRVKLREIVSESTALKLSKIQGEDREEKIAKSLHRALRFRFNDIYKGYLVKYRPSAAGLYLVTLEICREALLITPSGMGIDVDKFIEIYTNFLECEQSSTRKQHQEAADAINRFFNGLEITQGELNRYFRIEHGVVRVNPLSINTQSYIRLGYRGKVRTIKK